MQKLNIQTPEKTISIDLVGGDMSITLTELRVSAAPSDETLEWSHTLLDGEKVTEEKALKAIAELGPGWRMPTRPELESLLDLSRHDPAIDTEKFPDTQSYWYWTSTPCAWNDAAVWVVSFSYGGAVGSSHRSSDGCVRAVRAGQ